MLEDVLHVAAGLVVGNVLDPDVGVDRRVRLPARHGAWAGVVSRQRHRELAVVVIEKFAQVRCAQGDRDHRIEQRAYRRFGQMPALRDRIGGRGQHLHESAGVCTRYRVDAEQALLTHHGEDPVARYVGKAAGRGDCRGVGSGVAQAHVVEVAALRKRRNRLGVPAPGGGQPGCLHLHGGLLVCDDQRPLDAGVVDLIAFEQGPCPHQARRDAQRRLYRRIVRRCFRIEAVAAVHAVGSEIAVVITQSREIGEQRFGRGLAGRGCDRARTPIAPTRLARERRRHLPDPGQGLRIVARP